MEANSQTDLIEPHDCSDEIFQTNSAVSLINITKFLSEEAAGHVIPCNLSTFAI